METKRHREKKTAPVGKQSDSGLIRGITINLPAFDSATHDIRPEEENKLQKKLP